MSLSRQADHQHYITSTQTHATEGAKQQEKQERHPTAARDHHHCLEEEGNIQDPGTPCTPQELLSIEQLLEATFD